MHRLPIGVNLLDAEPELNRDESALAAGGAGDAAGQGRIPAFRTAVGDGAERESATSLNPGAVPGR